MDARDVKPLILFRIDKSVGSSSENRIYFREDNQITEDDMIYVKCIATIYPDGSSTVSRFLTVERMHADTTIEVLNFRVSTNR